VAFEGRYEAKITWMTDLINTLLDVSIPISAQAPTDSPLQGWYCKPAHCVAILQALSQHTARLLAEENGPRVLEEQFDAARLAFAQQLLDSLAQNP
jgi:hypothetical protein